MFILTYLKSMIFADPSSFSRGKALSDIVGMVNRAAWLFAFAVLVDSAQGESKPTDIAYWTSGIIEGVFGVFLPFALLLQILPIGYSVIFVNRPLNTFAYVSAGIWTVLYLVLLVCGIHTAALVADQSFSRDFDSIFKKVQDDSRLDRIEDDLKELLSRPAK